MIRVLNSDVIRKENKMPKPTKVLRDVCVDILDVQHKLSSDTQNERAAKGSLTKAIACISNAIQLLSRKESQE